MKESRDRNSRPSEDLAIADVLEQVDHRPWPLPSRRWSVTMRWHDLLFLHWPVPAESIRPHVPPSLEVDTFDGRAWLGVAPFRMTGVRPRFLPSGLFGLSLPELNVRTYVRSGDRGGVWFFSLDAASRLAVWAARAWYGLPYFRAEMSLRKDGERIRYRSERRHRGAPPAELAVEYAPAGEVFRAEPGSRTHWLIERYRLYAERAGGKVRYADIHHRPWPLQPAEAEVRRNRMTEGPGLRLPDREPLVHFARELHVLAWSPEPLPPRSRHLRTGLSR